MKNLIYCLIFLIPFYTNVETISEDEQYEFTVLHLNAKWNKKNSLDINSLVGCNLEWALLEEQPTKVQEKFSKIPIIALKKKGEPIKIWEGNIMFEPTVTVEEIQETIDSLK